jgi:hypothetical protein
MPTLTFAPSQIPVIMTAKEYLKEIKKKKKKGLEVWLKLQRACRASIKL